MLLVDYRDGSNYLREPLLRLGLPAVETTLNAGDLAFTSRDNRYSIGIEFKKLPDLASSLRTGRLSGEQLPKLLGPKGEFDYAWVLIEGRWQADAAGNVTVPRRHGWKAIPGGMSAAEMEKRVLSLELCGGLHVKWVNERVDTLRFIEYLFRWWTDKTLEDHVSHLAPHTPQSFLPVSDVRQTLMTYPGVGRVASLAVEKEFHGCLRDAGNAGPQRWADILVESKGKVRRLGNKVADDVVAYLTRRTE